MGNQFSFDLSELHGNPFSPTAGTDSPYLSLSFREALATLYYGLEYGSRILMVSADTGLGKTTLLRHFERRMQDRAHTLFISPNHEKGSELLNKLLVEIGGPAATNDLLAMRTQIDQILTTAAGAENPFILLLDYDENTAGSALDILCHLTSLGSYQEGLLRVVIAASPDVAEELLGSEFKGDIRHIPLSPLTAAEVESYIGYRLRLVGWRGSPLFTAKACALIAERSSAKPLAINDICLRVLANLAEQEAGRSDSADQNKAALLDESYVEFAISGLKSAEDMLRGSASCPVADSAIQDVATPARSLNRRMAALACIVLIVAIAIAGFWYRNALKAHSAKHLTAETTASFFVRLNRVFHDRISARLPNLAHAVTTAGAAGRSIIANLAAEAGSAPRRDGDTARLPRVASSAVSAMPSPAPSRSPAFDTVTAHLANGIPPVLSSSPAIVALKNVGDHRAESIAKKDQKVISAPRSRITVASRPSISSPVSPQTTATRPATIPRAPVVAEEDTATATRGEEEMAAYEIRLGDAYMNIGDFDQALRSFSRAIAFAPNDERAAQRLQEMAAYEIRLGDAYMNIGDYDKALRSFSRAVASAPGNKEAQEKMRRARRAKIVEENVLE